MTTPTPVTTKEHPTCFVHYSQDSDEHKAWVRDLAARLVHNGVETHFDEWDVQPGEDLTKYMETSVRNSDFVLLVCTPIFARKADSGSGGTGYEKSIITGEIYQGVAPRKFVPLLRKGNPSESLPSFLKSRVYIDFRYDKQFNQSFERLLRHLYKLPKYARPPLGSKPLLEDGHEKPRRPKGSRTYGTLQRALLSFVEGANTPDAVAKYLGCSVSYACRTLKELEQREWVLAEKETTSESYSLTQDGRSMAISFYVDSCERNRQETEDYDRRIFNALDGSVQPYVKIPTKTQLPYLILFPDDFNLAQLTFREGLGMAINGKGTFSNSKQVCDYLRIVSRNFNASSVCFTVWHPRDLMVGWGIPNLHSALDDVRQYQGLVFGAFLFGLHPTLLVGTNYGRKLSFEMLIFSWYLPDGRENTDLERLLRFAGPASSALYPVNIMEGPYEESEVHWRRSLEARIANSGRKYPILDYANRSLLTREHEEWYTWIIAGNPILREDLDKYGVYDDLLREVHRERLPLLPMTTIQGYEKNELKDEMVIDSFQLEYLRIDTGSLFPERYGGYTYLVNPYIRPAIGSSSATLGASESA